MLGLDGARCLNSGACLNPGGVRAVFIGEAARMGDVVLLRYALSARFRME